MKTGRLIFLDGLLYFVVYGYFLTVYNFFDSLAIFVLAGNFSLNSNLFKVILLSLTAIAISPSAILRTSFALASVVTILPLFNNAVYPTS